MFTVNTLAIQQLKRVIHQLCDMFVFGVLKGGVAIQEISATKVSQSPRDDEDVTIKTN